jgi:hypothetical protein
MARPKKPKHRPKHDLTNTQELRTPIPEFPKHTWIEFPKYTWSTKAPEDLTFVVTGSRDLANPIAAARVMIRAFDTIPDEDTVLIVHGGAVGIDKMADREAKSRGWDVKVYRPDYKKYSRHFAPLRRNEKMVDLKPDAVLAFWDGKSRGTKYTIDHAKKKGIPVIVHRLGLTTLETIEHEDEFETYTTKPLNLKDVEKTMRDVWKTRPIYESKDLEIDF